MELRRNSNNLDNTKATTHVRSSNGGRVRRSFLENTLIVVLIVAAISLITYLGVRLAGSLSNNVQVNSKQYQAVFLANGQVYFGKLKQVNNNYLRLSDIYYLQVQQSVQPDAAKNDQSKQPQVSLAKLGNELHGPEDAMYISRDQVLFWENLKEDGKVTKAIRDYTK
ncbi:hypothetical protein EPO04_03650 [Patescibacteria group bacterium]|nr:MAG: hypothetical protein EPO04_03650 [Patescibacteria group bacterium]